MNDYDEEALVARSRCNHTLGRNEAAIEDGELQVLCLLNKCALSVLYFEQLRFVIWIIASFFSGSPGRPCQKQGVNIGDRGSGKGSMRSQINAIKIMIISRHWNWQKNKDGSSAKKEFILVFVGSLRSWTLWTGSCRISPSPQVFKGFISILIYDFINDVISINMN